MKLNNAKDIRLGNTQVKAVYLGEQLIWPQKLPEPELPPDPAYEMLYAVKGGNGKSIGNPNGQRFPLAYDIDTTKDYLDIKIKMSIHHASSDTANTVKQMGCSGGIKFTFGEGDPYKYCYIRVNATYDVTDTSVTTVLLYLIFSDMYGNDLRIISEYNINIGEINEIEFKIENGEVYYGINGNLEKLDGVSDAVIINSYYYSLVFDNDMYYKDGAIKWNTSASNYIGCIQVYGYEITDGDRKRVYMPAECNGIKRFSGDSNSYTRNGFRLGLDTQSESLPDEFICIFGKVVDKIPTYKVNYPNSYPGPLENVYES